MNRHQRRTRVARARAATGGRSNDRLRDEIAPRAHESPQATQMSPSPTESIPAPEDLGLGRSATDPPQPHQQPETLTLSDSPTNNRIGSLVETPPPSKAEAVRIDPDESVSIEPSTDRTTSGEVRPGDVGLRSAPPGGHGAGGDRPMPMVTSTTGEAGQASPDPFDPERLRMSQDFAGSTRVKKLIITVPVAKPTKESFVRTHPDPAYRLATRVVELKEDKETYLVNPSLWGALAGEPTFVAKLLVTTVTRQGVLSLWPIRLPGPDGRIDEWNRSGMEIADIARTRWVRVVPNMGLGANEPQVATGIAVDPEFPDMPMSEILRVAFKGKYVDTLDHPVLRKLRGEV